jgi:hypothetical protein
MIDFEKAGEAFSYSGYSVDDPKDVRDLSDAPDYAFVGSLDFPLLSGLYGRNYDVILPGRGNNPDGTACEVAKDRMRVGALAYAAFGLTGNIVSSGKGSPGNKANIVSEAAALDNVIDTDVNPYLAAIGLRPISAGRRKQEERSRTTSSNFTESVLAGYLSGDGVIAVGQRAHAPRMLRTMSRIVLDKPFAVLTVPDDPLYPDVEHPGADLATAVTLFPVRTRWQSPRVAAQITRVMESLVWSGAKLLERPGDTRENYNEIDTTA